MHIRNSRRQLHGQLQTLDRLLWFRSHTDYIPNAIRQTLENKHQTWLNGILVVTKGTKYQQKHETTDVLTTLENK